MGLRNYLSASATLVTVTIAGCSQSSGEATPTEDSTSTETSTSTGADDSTPADTETPTNTGADDSTPADTETPTTDGASDGTQLQYEGDTLTLDNAADQEIRGTTDLGTGADLDVRVESESVRDPFVHLPETNIQSDGMFSATVDMTHHRDGTEFTVEVTADDETLTEADGRVV